MDSPMGYSNQLGSLLQYETETKILHCKRHNYLQGPKMKFHKTLNYLTVQSHHCYSHLSVEYQNNLTWKPSVHPNQIKDTFVNEVFLFSMSSACKTKTLSLPKTKPRLTVRYWHPHCFKVALFNTENRHDFT